LLASRLELLNLSLRISVRLPSRATVALWLVLALDIALRLTAVLSRRADVDWPRIQASRRINTRCLLDRLHLSIQIGVVVTCSATTVECSLLTQCLVDSLFFQKRFSLLLGHSSSKLLLTNISHRIFDLCKAAESVSVDVKDLAVFVDRVIFLVIRQCLRRTVHDPRSRLRRDPRQRFLRLLLGSNLPQPREGSSLVTAVGINSRQIDLGNCQIRLASDGLGQVLPCFGETTLLQVRKTKVAQQIAVFTVGAESGQVVSLGFVELLRPVADSAEHVVSGRVVRLETQHRFKLNPGVVKESLLHGFVAPREIFPQTGDVVHSDGWCLSLFLSFTRGRVSPASPADARLRSADCSARVERRFLRCQRLIRTERTEQSVVEQRCLTTGKQQTQARSNKCWEFAHEGNHPWLRQEVDRQDANRR